jgi:hypothetical protein
MPDTVAGLFATRAQAETGLRNLKDAGFAEDQLSLSTPRRGRRGHYGLKVLAGIVAGTVLGALIGAVLTGMIPGVKPIVSGNLLATFLLTATAGATTGGLVGALVSMAAAGDRALYYEQEVESGRYLITVAGDGLVEARRILRASGAMESEAIEAPLRPESG